MIGFQGQRARRHRHAGAAHEPVELQPGDCNAATSSQDEKQRAGRNGPHPEGPRVVSVPDALEFDEALATIDEWERVRGLLPALDEMAAGSHRYAEALTAALREELAARDGGPPAGHTALLEMGYVGISEMLRFRPPTWS